MLFRGHAGLASSLLCRASKVCKCSVPPANDSVGISCKCITVSGLYEEYCTCIQYLNCTRNTALMYSIWIVRGILHLCTVSGSYEEHCTSVQYLDCTKTIALMYSI